MSESQPTSTPTPEASPAVGDQKPADAPQPVQPLEPPKTEVPVLEPPKPAPDANKPAESTPSNTENPPQPPQDVPSTKQDTPSQEKITESVKAAEVEKPAVAQPTAPESKPIETTAEAPAANESSNTPVTEAKPQEPVKPNTDVPKESSQPAVTQPQPEPSQPQEEEGEGDFDIQSLTAGIMNILNEDLTAEGTSNHDLLKRIADLQEFIIKLIEILKEKTMLCASLDRQNLALTHQIKSLKDVVAITKDLLTIRNMEVEHLHEDLKLLEENIQVERTRQGVAAERLGQAMKLNDQLKTEYTTQLDLFQKLREKYNEKVVHLTKENKRLIGLVGENPEAATAPTAEIPPEMPPTQPEVLPEVVKPAEDPTLPEGSPAQPEETTTGQ